MYCKILTCVAHFCQIFLLALQPFYGPFSGTTWVSRCQKNFWTLWCKGRLTEADTQTIRLGATPSVLTSDHLHHPHFLQAGCPSCRSTNSVKTLKATNLFISCEHLISKWPKLTVPYCRMVYVGLSAVSSRCQTVYGINRRY